MTKTFFIISLVALFSSALFGQTVTIPVGDQAVMYTVPQHRVEYIYCSVTDSCIYANTMKGQRYNTMYPWYPYPSDYFLLEDRPDSSKMFFHPLKAGVFKDTFSFYFQGQPNNQNHCYPGECNGIDLIDKIVTGIAYYDSSVKFRPEMLTTDRQFYLLDSDRYHYIAGQSYLYKPITIYNNTKDTVHCNSIALNIDTSTHLQMQLVLNSQVVTEFSLPAFSYSTITPTFTSGATPFPDTSTYKGKITFHIHTTALDSVFGIDAGFIFYPYHSSVAVSNKRSDPESLLVYPNPVQKLATVIFKLPLESVADLSLFDLLGNKLKTLSNGFLSMGEHRYSLSLDPGTYYLRCESEGSVLTRKVIVE